MFDNSKSAANDNTNARVMRLAAQVLQGAVEYAKHDSCRFIFAHDAQELRNQLRPRLVIHND